MAEVKAMIDAGRATAAAPLGPALGPLGVNIGAIVEEINKKTKAFEGMKIPVVITIHPDKSFEIKVGSPPTSSLIKKELKIEKGAKNPKLENVGNLSLPQIIKIAKMKIDHLNSTQIKKASNEVMGTCQQMGVTIEGRKASEIIKEVNEGKHDSLFEEN